MVGFNWWRGNGLLRGGRPRRRWRGEREEYIDDVSGAALDPELVRVARQEEMAEVKKHNVYTKADWDQSMSRLGKRRPSKSGG